MYTVAIDIGGTFTDLVMSDGDGLMTLFKAQTVPESPVDGVVNALKLAANYYDVSLEDFLDNTDTLVHGTTVATNAVLTGATAKTGLITNKGFEDLLLIGLGSKGKAAEDMFRSHMAYPEPFIPRYLTAGITGRINAEGGEETALDTDEVLVAANQMKKYAVEAVAISMIWSPVNPEHELIVSKIISNELPGIPFSISSEVNPVIREYERTSTTAIDAALKPQFSKYVLDLEKRLGELGYHNDFLMINSNGGVMKVDELAALPIYAIKSGPSIGPSAGLALSDREGLGNNVLVCDMGGTSFDASLVTNGRIVATTDNQVGSYHYNVSCVEVNSIGAGGGSIARVDPGGLMLVGPASAGASPGPACYGLGGEEPTVTDANIMLGYLNPDYFLGGSIKLDAKLSMATIKDKLSSRLQTSVVEAASLVYAVVNQSMVKGLEEVSIRRGIDPREYLLVAGGGACGMHVVPIAQELGIDRILIPRMAAGLCAYGTLFGDMIFQRSQGVITRSDQFDFDKVNEVMSGLEAEGVGFLDRAKIPSDMRRLEFIMSARYPYQAWEIEVPLLWNQVSNDKLPELLNLFHESHDARYGFRVDHQMECVGITVKAIGLRPKFKLNEDERTGGDVSEAKKGTRQAYFLDVKQFIDTDVYEGRKLYYGDQINGPAIIEELQTTIVVPNGYKASLTKLGNYLLEVDGHPETIMADRGGQ